MSEQVDEGLVQDLTLRAEAAEARVRELEEENRELALAHAEAESDVTTLQAQLELVREWQTRTVHTEAADSLWKFMDAAVESAMADGAHVGAAEGE